LQSRNGLWHQMLDDQETYLETSCTAMFTFSIARGVNRGWIENVYATVAQAGWKALEKKVMEDGQIAGVCTGTAVANDKVYYANRPQSIFAYHGYGPVLLAGAEMIQLMKNFDVKVISSTFQYWRKQ
ncbi:MAG: glycoside hydrolase family 88 protein, partial [bacterium]